MLVSSLYVQILDSRIKLSLTWDNKFLMRVLEVSPQWLFQLYHFSNQFKALATSLLLSPAFPRPAFCRKPSSKASDKTLSTQPVSGTVRWLQAQRGTSNQPQWFYPATKSNRSPGAWEECIWTTLSRPSLPPPRKSSPQANWPGPQACCICVCVCVCMSVFPLGSWLMKSHPLPLPQIKTSWLQLWANSAHTSWALLAASENAVSCSDANNHFLSRACLDRVPIWMGSRGEQRKSMRLGLSAGILLPSTFPEFREWSVPPGSVEDKRERFPAFPTAAAVPTPWPAPEDQHLWPLNRFSCLLACPLKMPAAIVIPSLIHSNVSYCTLNCTGYCCRRYQNHIVGGRICP